MLTTDICRICLNKNVPMFTLKNSLQNVYETITNGHIKPDKPLLVCFICYSRLKSCGKLQQQAIKSNELLEKISNGENELIHLIESQNHQHLQYTPVYHLHLEPDNEEIDFKPNINFIQTIVKNETDNKFEETNENQDTSVNLDAFQDRDDSDDSEDLPLIVIGSKKKEIKTKKKRRNKDEKDYKLNAKEIELTIEEQRIELLQRANTNNYLNSPYKCEKCYKGFVDPQAFSNHMEKHDMSSGPHECIICQLRYISSRQLRAHAVAAHERRYACNECPHRSHTRHQARDHEKWHNGFTYPCRICGQKFQKPTSYLTHTRKHHSAHVCVRCGDSFVGRHGLLMHISKTHRRDGENDTTEEAETERYCSDCNIQFLNINAWKKHILTSFKHTTKNDNSNCDICGVSITSDTRGSHMRGHMRELRPRGAAPAPIAVLQCPQCESEFSSRSRLQAHVRRVHLGLKYDKNVVCEMCGKKCTSAAGLRYHQRAHTGERPHACAHCPARFAHRARLRLHARTHSGERPYACRACDKRFAQKPTLNRHYRVHSGARPYACTQCTKCFSQSNSLKLHVRTVHLKLPHVRKNKDN